MESSDNYIDDGVHQSPVIGYSDYGHVLRFGTWTNGDQVHWSFRHAVCARYTIAFLSALPRLIYGGFCLPGNLKYSREMKRKMLCLYDSIYLSDLEVVCFC